MDLRQLLKAADQSAAPVAGRVGSAQQIAAISRRRRRRRRIVATATAAASVCLALSIPLLYGWLPPTSITRIDHRLVHDALAPPKPQTSRVQALVDKAERLRRQANELAERVTTKYRESQSFRHDGSQLTPGTDIPTEAVISLEYSRILSEELGDSAAAAEELRRIQRHYPNTRWAELAAQNLARLQNGS